MRNELTSWRPPSGSKRIARERRDSSSRVGRFAVAIVAVAVVWLIVLPWLAQRPMMKTHLDWLDARSINASAMYYTELEAMQPILERLEGPQRTVGP